MRGEAGPTTSGGNASSIPKTVGIPFVHECERVTRSRGDLRFPEHSVRFSRRTQTARLVRLPHD